MKVFRLLLALTVCAALQTLAQEPKPGLRRRRIRFCRKDCRKSMVADAAHVQEFVIVRFKQQKHKREIETAEMGGGESRNKANVYHVTIRRLAPEIFLVTPESSLPAGEYILSQSTYATEGYHFGISGTAVGTKE